MTFAFFHSIRRFAYIKRTADALHYSLSVRRAQGTFGQSGISWNVNHCRIDKYKNANHLWLGSCVPDKQEILKTTDKQIATILANVNAGCFYSLIAWMPIQTPPTTFFWRAIVFQNIFICVHQKKETHTSLQKLKGEW